MDDPHIISVDKLVIDYITAAGPVRVVNNVSFEIKRGEVLGFVGESGCGKSSIAHALARILAPPAVIRGGRILFDGADVLAMTEDELRAFRWRSISFVPQSAMNSLCPVLTVGEQIIDVITTHDRVRTRVARERTAKLLELVGVDPAREGSYPHELSGGMRQRVAIAMALALHPPLVVMDEPTTALDVVVQHEVLLRIAKLQTELGMSILFITHDMSIVSQFATHIAVLYAGEIVEMAPAREIFQSPCHPYTKGLSSSLATVQGDRRRLMGIPGSPPNMLHKPTGCAFQTRCPQAATRCTIEAPALVRLDNHRSVACHFAAS
jgi:peptide/nickel transport system ATP-binding protein